MKTKSRLFAPHRALLALMLLALPAINAHAAESSLDGVWKLSPAQSELQPVDGKKLPFTDGGRAQYEKNLAAAARKDYSFDATTTRCSSPGLPRLMLTPKLIRIYQRPQIVTMLFEWNRLFRQIEMRPGKREKLDTATMNGQSFGRWEGATLVVESYDLSERKLLDGLIPNSEKLELVERIRLRDSATLEDRITIKDPEIFSRSWDAVLTYKRQSDALFPFLEDVCLDNRAGVPPPLGPSSP
ncbi:hypothetical protein [Hydrocarboniphaga sp.]|uniref:hypothetical protein n=1 Tax=Hydrocarboniphaga sp. TaxID=2033016 RepID=UPI003D116A07